MLLATSRIQKPNMNIATALGLYEPWSPRSHPMSAECLIIRTETAINTAPREYERPPAAKSACAVVAHVAHQGLHQEPRQRPAEPYHASPGMRDPQLQHIRRQQRQLQRPPKLNPARHRTTRSSRLNGTLGSIVV